MNNSEKKSKKENSHYVMATLAGEQREIFDFKLNEKNTDYWNAWISSDMDWEDKQMIKEDDGSSVLDDCPNWEDVSKDVKKLFKERLPNAEIPEPFDRVDFRNVELTKGVYFGGFLFKGADFNRAVFSGNIDFSNAVFSETAKFVGTTFKGDAYFGGNKFKENADFKDAEFSGNANFEEAVFFKDADFKGAKFYGDAKFDGAEVSGYQYIEAAIFEKGHSGIKLRKLPERIIRRDDITLIETDKKQPAAENPWYVLATLAGEQAEIYDFALAQKNRAYWNAWASQGMNKKEKKYIISAEIIRILDGCPDWVDVSVKIEEIFKKRLPNAEMPDPARGVNFSDVEFSNNADFNRFFFPASTYFYKAVFSEDANFGSTVLSGDADFNGATFSGNGYLKGVALYGNGYLNDATFYRDADFSNAALLGHVNFDDTKFSGNAKFVSADLSRDTDFLNATFCGDADFRNATFCGDADFNGATFSGNGYFQETKFEKGHRGLDLIKLNELRRLEEKKI